MSWTSLAVYLGWVMLGVYMAWRVLTDMYGKSEGFTPIADYATPPTYRGRWPIDDWYCIKFGKNLEYNRKSFVEVIYAEYFLRATMQRIDKIENKTKRLKPASEPNENTQLTSLEEQLKQLKWERRDQEIYLYERELMIPARPLKEKYDSLRQSRTRYKPESEIEVVKKGAKKRPPTQALSELSLKQKASILSWYYGPTWP